MGYNVNVIHLYVCTYMYVSWYARSEKVKHVYRNRTPSSSTSVRSYKTVLCGHVIVAYVYIAKQFVTNEYPWGSDK